MFPTRAWCLCFHRSKCLSRNCALAHLRFCFPSFFWSQCGGLCVSLVCLCSQRLELTHATASWLKSKTVFIHSPYSINLVAEPMEQVHAELVRLATELEAVRGQV